MVAFSGGFLVNYIDFDNVMTAITSPSTNPVGISPLHSTRPVMRHAHGTYRRGCPCQRTQVLHPRPVANKIYQFCESPDILNSDPPSSIAGLWSYMAQRELSRDSDGFDHQVQSHGCKMNHIQTYLEKYTQDQCKLARISGIWRYSLGRGQSSPQPSHP